MKQYQKTLLVWLVLGLVVVSLWTSLGKRTSAKLEKPFSDFISSLEQGDIKNVSIIGQDFDGELKNGTTFRSTGVVTDNIIGLMNKANKDFGTEYNIRKEEVGTFWVILAQWIPMIFIVGLFIFFMRQIQIGGGKAMSFGKSRARLLTENQSKVTFNDVAGIEECKVELQEIVEFLKNPKKF